MNFESIAVVILFTLPSSALSEQKEYQRDLVLHYTFDQRDNVTVLNTLGKQHPGRPKRATFAEQKKSGKALRIRQNNVKSGFVETADHEDFKTPNFTVAAWINLGQSNSNGSVVCKHDWFGGGARGFVLRCYNGKQLNFTGGRRLVGRQWEDDLARSSMDSCGRGV